MLRKKPTRSPEEEKFIVATQQERIQRAEAIEWTYTLPPHR
jgi:hypothetical protein